MSAELDALDLSAREVAERLCDVERAKIDRDETALSKARAQLAVVCHTYNKLIATADDETRAAHRVRALGTELTRQIA